MDIAKCAPLLALIARNAATRKPAQETATWQTTTSAVASALSISQQAASLQLRKAASVGLISNQTSPQGVRLCLTLKGRKKLQSYARQLAGSSIAQSALSGTLVSGLGEGRFYLSQEEYREVINKAAGFTPFAGTLNLQVAATETATFLDTLRPIVVMGFQRKDRTFGGFTLYPCTMTKKSVRPARKTTRRRAASHASEGYQVAIIRPERTSHPDTIIEIIALMNLRRALDLADGDTLMLHTTGDLH
ncbi:hypothetical protein COY28_00435 [Candidatus Woesearchaeota archaeon CG_4_10_14_0_2_um_filter_57_5]|nr:MAG: hypothetical protein AUJ68_06305 [Candidatus Woesearchaeota archaeon CG1_02_57_44]PIN68254.1 MAG: hypothetical protein COV94_05710 [Candidatus Woesearchaeota archaeon CG11_big_fil_rev_8_21_14_0_20_57_5]PIZ56971.1 MAG: hypothetical protein COY28_00435 [Candidatus Woesearchaeota archaeon CG_4_10_14_0_2_um_filter_57_5]